MCYWERHAYNIIGFSLLAGVHLNIDYILLGITTEIKWRFHPDFIIMYIVLKKHFGNIIRNICQLNVAIFAQNKTIIIASLFIAFFSFILFYCVIIAIVFKAVCMYMYVHERVYCVELVYWTQRIMYCVELVYWTQRIMYCVELVYWAQRIMYCVELVYRVQRIMYCVELVYWARWCTGLSECTRICLKKIFFTGGFSLATFCLHFFICWMNHFACSTYRRHVIKIS